MQVSSPIALIFFSRSAAAEAASKHWLGNGRRQHNRALAQVLIAQAKRNIQDSQLEIIHCDERMQRGKTFGERLANAFADVFAQGYRAAIAVGNDSPQLGKTDWLAVRTALAQGQTILGPTLRGGAYLIGLQADHFDEAVLAALPWQTSKTYKALHAHLMGNSKASVYTLAVLRDLNTSDDLWACIHQPHNGYVRALVAILSPTQAIPERTWQPQHSFSWSGIAHRGPPGF